MDLDRKNILTIILGQEIFFILLAFVWLFLRNFNAITTEGLFALPNLNPFKGFTIDLLSVGYSVLACLFLIVLSFIMLYTYEPFKKAVIAIDKMLLSKLFKRDFLPIAILSGLGEELFFRGVLQLETSILFASVVFAILHFIGREFWVYSLWALFGGLFFGNLYSYTDNLFIVIFCHILNNFIALSFWNKKLISE